MGAAGPDIAPPYVGQGIHQRAPVIDEHHVLFLLLLRKGAVFVVGKGVHGHLVVPVHHLGVGLKHLLGNIILLRQGMLPGKQHNIGPGRQGDDPQVLAVGHFEKELHVVGVGPQDADVRLPGGHAADDLVIGVLLKLYPEGEAALRQAVDVLRHADADLGGAARNQGQHPGLADAALVHILQAVKSGDDVGGIADEHLSELRTLDALPRPVENPGPQLRLQLADGGAEIGLGHEEVLRRPGYGPAPICLHCVNQLLYGQCASLRCWSPASNMAHYSRPPGP